MEADPIGELITEIAQLRSLVSRSIAHVRYLEAKIERAAPVLAAADAWARAIGGRHGANEAGQALLGAVEVWRKKEEHV